MKTESDAHELWCPMAQITEGGANCIASGCMMWQWEMKRVFHDSPDPRSERWAEDVPTDKGYCGLVKS